MNGAALDLSILWPALAAGLLVLATHVPLGMQVLDRGIVFIDLAIAQIAGLGVILAHGLGLAEQPWTVQAAALGAALLGAALLTWTERRAGRDQEALIGVLFVLASCIGILALASNPHGGEHLRDLLVGQILWVDMRQLAALAVVTALLAAWMAIGGTRRFRAFGFYGAFAIAVTASVQLVGVYLVFSSLIVPTLATSALRGRTRLLAALGVGAAGYAAGLAMSALFDLPSGAVIVCAMAAIGLAVRLALPRRPHGEQWARDTA
jgi:zinc/manganese transport system permease protein